MPVCTPSWLRGWCLLFVLLCLTQCSRPVVSMWRGIAWRVDETGLDPLEGMGARRQALPRGVLLGEGRPSPFSLEGQQFVREVNTT